MSRIVFIKRLDQFIALQKERPDLARSAQVVALSARAWIALREAGIDCQAASEFLSAKDLREITVEARILSRSWFETFRQELSYRGLNLGEMVRIDNIWFFRELLAADTVARRIMNQLRPSEVYLFAQRQVSCLQGHRAKPSHDVCEAALIDSFSRSGVKTINLVKINRGRFPFLPVKYKRYLLRAARFLKNPRSALDAIQNDEPQMSRAPRPLPFAERGERLLLAIGEEVDLLSLAPLVEMIDSSPRYKAVLVNSDSEILTVKARSGIATISSETVFPLLDSYPATTDKETAGRIASARRAFDRAQRVRLYGKDSPLNNRLMDFHFDAVWSGFLKSLIPHIDRVNALLDDVNPDAVIVAGVEQAKERATVKIAKNLGIRTIGIPHGFIGNVDAYEFETDHFLAWGESSRRCLIEEFDKQPESISVFGPLHLNRIAQRNHTVARTTDRRRLLALTSRAAPVCYDPVDLRVFEDVWKAISSFVERSTDVELIIKPHPGGGDFEDYYEKLCAMLPEGRARIERSRRLEDMTDGVDAVVAVIDASTAILVAQLLRLPTLFIRAAWRDMYWAVRAWGLPNGVESVEAVDEIAPALERLMFDEDFRQVSIERGQRLIENNLKPYEPEGPQPELLSILDRCFAAQDHSSRVCA
ncbi:MAG: hypothetical protein AB1631_17575 [Acidobacteriota bacterium]